MTESIFRLFRQCCTRHSQDEYHGNLRGACHSRCQARAGVRRHLPFLLLLCLAATSYDTAVATPPWKLQLDEIVNDAKAYLSMASSAPTTASTASSPLETDPAFRMARLSWAEVKYRTANEVRSSLDSLPPATAPVDFFRFLEDLKDRKENFEKESAVYAEQAQLASKKNEEALRIVSEDRVRFLGRLAALIGLVRKEMLHTFERCYPDEKQRTNIQSTVFRTLSEEKEKERQRAEQRARQAQALADRKKKEADELARLAGEELSRASDEATRQLARLRMDYARLNAAAEAYKASALEAEVALREEEARFQKIRATLVAQVPALLALEPGAAKVSEKRAEWRRKRDELEQSAQILEKECAVLRERIEGLRTERDKFREIYDKLYSGLEANRKDSLYRKRVFYARQAYRKSAARLDYYRTRIEWLERRRKLLLRCRESYCWALEQIEGHAVRRYLGQTMTQWFDFLFALVLTYVAAWLVRGLFRFVLRRFATQSKWTWDNIVMEEMGLPIRVLVILAGLWFALSILSLPGRYWKLAATIRKSLEVLWLGFLSWRVVNALNRLLEPKLQATESTLDDQLLRFVRRGLRLIIIVITCIYVLENFGWKVSSLLAGLGIGGLAFALAAKDTLANFFGSIVLFLDRPFHIGNWVIIAGAEGIVEDIGIRSTRIRTFKDTVVTIPNATVANSSAENIHSFRKRRLFFKLTLRLDTPVEKIEETVKRIRNLLTDHPMILDGFYVYVTGIPADGIEVMVYCFVATRDWGEWMHHSQTIYLSILRMLQEIGVGLAYRTQTVELENKLPIEFTSPGDLFDTRK